MEIISSRSRTVKSDESRGRQNIFMCLAALPCHQFLPIHEWRLGNIAIWILTGLMLCSKSFLLPYTFKVARYSLSGSIPPKFERKLRRHKQRLGKINTTVVLDKDENLL